MMEFIRKLEQTIAGWYKNAPHLPPNGQKWLWQNAWWIVLIGVVIAGFAIFSIFGGLLVALALLTGVAGPVGAAIGVIAIIAAALSMAFTLALLVLEALAIKPLKNLQKKGWTLIFIAMLLNATAAVVGFVLTFEPITFITSLLTVAVTGYFLFEIRHLYGEHANQEAVPLAAEAAKNNPTVESLPSN